MIKFRQIRDALIIGFAVTFLFLIIQIFIGNPLSSLDRPMHDLLERKGLKTNKDIVLVNLDEQSLVELGDSLYYYGYWMPELLKQLKTAKAIGITLPYLQKEPVTPQLKARLEQEKLDSLKRWFKIAPARGKAIIDSLFTPIKWDSELTSVIDSNRNVFVNFAMLNTKVNDDILLGEISIKRNPENLRKNTAIIDKKDFNAPPINVVRVCRGIGHLSVFYDNLGIVRKAPMIALCKNKIYGSLAFAMYWRIKKPEQVDIPSSRIITFDNKEIRFGEGYTFRVHYTSAYKNFKHYSVSKILAGKVPTKLFKDKYVFIGSTVDPFAMAVPTPVDGHMPQMVFQANVLHGLLTEQQAVPPSIVAAFILTFLLSTLSALAILLYWRKFTLPILAALIFLFYLIVAGSASNGVRISFFTPLLASFLALGVGYIVYYYTDGKRRTYIKQMVGQYFPAEQEKEYIERFMNLPYFRINKESAIMAVYLDFEKKGKSLQEALKSFEEFRTNILKTVRKHGGLRMSFTGNASMFFFVGKQSYTKACQASLEIRRFFTNFSAKYAAEGIGEFTLGIGLASGETFVSTLGKVPLVDLAIFGEPVLVARELAIWNFELKTKILMEEGLKDHLPQGSKIKELGELEIVGKKYTVYEYLR